MGWCDDSGLHEGYLVGLVREMGQHPEFRELGYNRPEPPSETLEYVQVACSCGWRSPRLMAPFGTRWMPHSVLAPEWFEDEVCKLWKEHLELESKRDKRFEFYSNGVQHIGRPPL